MEKQLARLLCAYGIFLIAMGFIGWAASGFSPEARTAIMSGGMSGLIMIGLSFGAALNSAIGFVARIFGFLFTLMFAGVFSWRTTIAIGEHGTEDWALYKVVVIGTMMLVSYGLLLAMTVMHFKAQAAKKAAA